MKFDVPQVYISCLWVQLCVLVLRNTIGVTFGIRNISTLVRRHHNLNDIPSVFFQRRVTISVLVHNQAGFFYPLNRSAIHIVVIVFTSGTWF